jgi:hypothetical protein
MAITIHAARKGAVCYSALHLARYTVALGVFASPSSSPRFLARYAETFALFMQRSEQ